MEFRPNASPIEVIKKGAFGGTYFRDIFSCVNDRWYKDSWKEFKGLKGIDKKHYCSDFYDVNLNCYGVKVGTSLRFWEKKGWINEIDPYGWFQWYYLGRRVKMIKDKLKDGEKLLVDLLVF